MPELLSMRDALAKALSHHEQREGPARGARYCVCGEWRHGEEWSEHVVDALLASGAVIDTTTLADDEALLNRINNTRVNGSYGLFSTVEPVRDVLRALAAALSERDA